MKNWLLGTGLVTGGVALFLLLFVLGFSRQVAVGVGMVVSISGFAIQVYAAFSMKSSFERQHRLAQQKYEALMKRAQKLPLE